MTKQAKQNLKTAAIIVGSVAVVAGLVYYFKDNEKVEHFIAGTKETVADAFNQTKSYAEDSVKKAKKMAEEYV